MRMNDHKAMVGRLDRSMPGLLERHVDRHNIIRFVTLEVNRAVRKERKCWVARENHYLATIDNLRYRPDGNP